MKVYAASYFYEECDPSMIAIGRDPKQVQRAVKSAMKEEAENWADDETRDPDYAPIAWSGVHSYDLADLVVSASQRREVLTALRRREVYWSSN